jgi:hypothetical protein
VEVVGVEGRRRAFRRRAGIDTRRVAEVTTPRDQWRGRAFDTILANRMNVGSRELMTVRQLGRCAWESGFRIERPGVIRAHNGLACRVG